MAYKTTEARKEYERRYYRRNRLKIIADKAARRTAMTEADREEARAYARARYAAQSRVRVGDAK